MGACLVCHGVLLPNGEENELVAGRKVKMGFWRRDSREGKMYDATESGDDDTRACQWGQAQAEGPASPRILENSFTEHEGGRGGGSGPAVRK